MKKSERMQVLVNLSQRKEDEVAKALAKDQARLQHDQQKLQELKDYAAQYDQERNLLGLSPYLTTNYQHFVNRLQQAIQQQDQQVKRSQQQVTMSMKRWQNARAKTKGMDWLKDKSVREELNIEQILQIHHCAQRGQGFCYQLELYQFEHEKTG